jgi:hypothetical protein
MGMLGIEPRQMIYTDKKQLTIQLTIQNHNTEPLYDIPLEVSLHYILKTIFCNLYACMSYPKASFSSLSCTTRIFK